MGWGKWFSDDNGQKVSEKTIHRSDGSSQEHFLRSGSGGSKSDHSHIVVNKDSSGKITSAHSNVVKSKRE